MRRLGACKIHNTGLASVCSKAMVLLLLIHWLFVLSLLGLVGVVIGPYYALLSGLSLSQSSGRGRIDSCFTLIVFLLTLFLSLVLCVSSSRCLGLGCSVYIL